MPGRLAGWVLMLLRLVLMRQTSGIIGLLSVEFPFALLLANLVEKLTLCHLNAYPIWIRMPVKH